MTQTAIVCLAIWLLLFGVAHFVPGLAILVAVGAIIEGIIILAGSRLTS